MKFRFYFGVFAGFVLACFIFFFFMFFYPSIFHVREQKNSPEVPTRAVAYSRIYSASYIPETNYLEYQLAAYDPELGYPIDEPVAYGQQPSEDPAAPQLAYQGQQYGISYDYQALNPSPPEVSDERQRSQPAYPKEDTVPLLTTYHGALYHAQNPSTWNAPQCALNYTLG